VATFSTGIMGIFAPALTEAENSFASSLLRRTNRIDRFADA
jgi:hypothetical protein